MNKIKNILLCGLILFAVNAYSQDSSATPTDPPVVEQPSDDGGVVPSELPSWTTILFAVVGYVGRWLQSKGYIAKIEKGHEWAVQKFNQADDLFMDLIGGLQNPNEEKARSVIAKWNALRAKQQPT